MQRLQRLLAHAGVGSRRACERLIRAGRVRVNGVVIPDPAHSTDPDRDQVAVDGRPVPLQVPQLYVLVHKPVRCLTTRQDERGRRTVLHLLPDELQHLYPVGRLDWDAAGLVLLMNDGDLAYRLMHPRYGVPKTYVAEVTGRPQEGALRRLREGVELDDGRTAPARVQRQSRDEVDATLRVTIREGRTHQIKRMLAAVGHPVRRLTRIGFGPLHLGKSPPGSWRLLTDKEVRALREGVGLHDEPE